MRLAFPVFCFAFVATCGAAEPPALLKVNQSGYQSQGQKLAVIPGKTNTLFS